MRMDHLNVLLHSGMHVWLFPKDEKSHIFAVQ